MKSENTVGIIGTGSIGKRHIRGIKKNAEKYNIGKIIFYDKNQERLNDVSNQFKNSLVSSSSIDEIYSNSDYIFICTPTSIHEEPFQKSLESNAKKIYLEKPLSSDLKGWRKYYEMSKKGTLGKEITVGYFLRFHPVIQEIKKIIHEKKFGEILYARAVDGFYLPYWHPYEDYKSFYMSSRALGGGALLDTSHEIDYICWLFGEIKEVYGNVQHVSNLDIHADDLTRISAQTTKGINLDIHLDLLQFEEERSIQIIFEKSVIKASLIDGNISIITPNDNDNISYKLEVNFDELYYLAYDEFFNNENETRSSSTLHEAFKILEVIEAVRLSSSVGSKVTLPLWTIN